MADAGYTLVQHSGFGYAGKPGFCQAVETRTLTKGDATRVRKAGGVIVPTYSEAESLAEHVNYPPEVVGMHPRCRGNFSKKKVDQLRIYVPTDFCKAPIVVRAVMEL